MSKWKPIDNSEITSEVNIVHKSFTLDNSASGQKFIQFKSGSSSDFPSNNSGSYWDAARLNFYLSGSSFHFTSHTSSYLDGLRFGDLHNSFLRQYTIDTLNKTHTNKFHSTGSTLSISQYYFGDEIQRGSFTLTDNSHPSGTVIIVDDGYGNLYAPSASISSSATALSSSDNYVGNISYNLGIINITETGSFSSSMSYKSVGTGLDGGIGSGSYTVKFNSTHIINTKEYSLKIGKKDFNFTNNPTVKRFGTTFGSKASSSLLSSPHIKDDILSSSLSGSWGPMMTTIGFYRQYTDGTMDNQPIMVARYPQPIMIRRDIDLILKIKIDI